VSSLTAWHVDPNDPRAPTLEIWNELSPSERRRVLDALPSELQATLPPEGDPHRIPKHKALDALEAFFRKLGRRVYLSSELPVYYPGERVFAPDLIAVLDVEPGERLRWVVVEEGKGIDFALEVTLSGSRQKDLQENVERYARLKIPEYFVFDRRNHRLHGWRLSGNQYERIVPQGGRWESLVLGLMLAVEAHRVRFYLGTAVVPESEELVARANALVDDLQNRLALAEQRAEEEKQRAEEEKQRAESAERRVHDLEAEVERLRAASKNGEP
jgi:Uma2 family endonuclease